MTKLQHPDNTGKPIEVRDEDIDTYLKSGWAEVEAPKTESK